MKINKFLALGFLIFSFVLTPAVSKAQSNAETCQRQTNLFSSLSDRVVGLRQALGLEQFAVWLQRTVGIGEQIRQQCGSSSERNSGSASPERAAFHTFRVRVVDSQTGRGISGATVSITGIGTPFPWSALVPRPTDADGYTSDVTLVNGSTYFGTVTKDGYQSFSLGSSVVGSAYYLDDYVRMVRLNTREYANQLANPPSPSAPETTRQVRWEIKDAGNRSRLSGVALRVYRADINPAQFVASFFTDSAGSVGWRLPTGRTYRVNASRTGYADADWTFDLIADDATLVVSKTLTLTGASSGATYSISGSLGTSGAIVSITGGSGGSGSCSVSSSNYTCSGIPSGANVVITPHKSSGTFSPSNRPFNSVTRNYIGYNFYFTADVTTAPPPPTTASITVTAPSVNSSWTSSNGPVIQWSSANIPAGTPILVKLLTPANNEVSGFSNFSTANDGSESGRLTGSSIPSGYYWFQLSTTVNGQPVYGGSGIFQFTQYGPSGGTTQPPAGGSASITVTTPSVNSSWTSSNGPVIQWSSANIPPGTPLTVELMTPANAPVSAFTNFSTANDGSESGRLTGSAVPSGYYWFRLTATVNGQPVYGGSGVFQFTQYGPSGGTTQPPAGGSASITVTTPVAGYVWKKTNVHSVTWRTTTDIPATNDISIKLFYPNNTQVPTSQFNGYITANDGERDVYAPNVAPGSYYLKLSTVVNGQTVYGGSSVFQITN